MEHSLTNIPSVADSSVTLPSVLLKTDIKTLPDRRLDSESKTPENETVENAKGDIASNPYLDSSLMESLEQFQPKHNEEFLSSHGVDNESKDEDVVGDGDGDGAGDDVEGGLSVRAQSMKDYLNRTEEVQAVLLRADGSSEETPYDCSSKQTNSILNGRPSIIGELEDIQVLVVRSLNGSGNENKHRLPVPLCTEQHRGDYLLFRVDAAGNAQSVSLKEYEEYVADHGTLMVTGNSIDSQRIKSQCLGSSDSSS